MQSFFDKGRAVQLITHAETVPAEANFTKCIEAAEGDYAAIFHADDMYESSMLAEQVDFLEHNKKCVAVATNTGFVNGDGQCLKSSKFVPYELRKRNATALTRAMFANLIFKYGNFITCPSVLFRTDILVNHVRKFNGADFQTSADLDVWFRLTEVDCLGFIRKPLMQYRVSDSSYAHRSARSRIEDSHMFLVLNNFLSHHVHDEKMLLTLRRHQRFLLMKDRTLTNINRFLAGRYDFRENAIGENVRLMWSSRFHFKYFLVALFAKLIMNAPGRIALQYLVKKAWHSDRFLCRFR